MIKVISFDIGGTILVNEDNNKYNLKELSKLVNLPYDLVRNAYKNIFQCQKDTLDNLINKFCQQLNIDSFDNLKVFFENKFKNNNVIYNENIVEIIKKLKEMGYIIILLSNSTCFNNNDLKLISPYITKTYYSYEIGFTKSDSELYEYVLKDLKISKDEILHIGDDLKSDYLMPIKYGWNALYYGENNDVVNIKKLNEIFDIVGGFYGKGYTRRN